MKEKTRDIEMAVLLMDKTWYTTMVDIPADTTEDEIENVAIKRANELLDGDFKKGLISKIDIHWIPPLEEE